MKIDIIKDQLNKLNFIKLMNDKNKIAEPCNEPCIEGYDCTCEQYKYKPHPYLPDMLTYVERSRKQGNCSPFEYEQEEMDTKELYSIYNYSYFISQRAHLSMFTVCDRKGVPMKRLKPEDFGYTEKNSTSKAWDAYESHVREWEEGDKKVIFSGFKYVDDSEDYDAHLVFPNGEWLTYPDNIGNSHGMKTIKDIITNHRNHYFLLK